MSKPDVSPEAGKTKLTRSVRLVIELSKLNKPKGNKL